MTEMRSTLKPEDPFNFSHCIGAGVRTLYIEDFIYMLNLHQILMIIKEYAMADLRNWILKQNLQ